MSTQSSSALTEAIAAARAGERSRARELLTKLIRADSANPEYWIWLSSVVETERERIYCLESALKLDPTNQTAQRGLVILGARTPKPAEIAAAPRIARRQAAPVAASVGAAKGLPATLPFGPPALRSIPTIWLLVGGGALGLVLLGIAGAAVVLFLTTPPQLVPAPTLPPLPPTGTATLENTPVVATSTPVPAATRIYRTPVPTEIALTPLAFLVPASPTPTPLLGLTPHPSYGAYEAGISALRSGDYPAVLQYMDQVIALDPNMPDVYYFRGEALRLLDQPADAMAAYDAAIAVDETYAPAYLGRARALLSVRLAQNPNMGAEALPTDFEEAIRRDPLLSDAYLDLASFYGSRRLWLKVEEILLKALDAGLTTPAIYIRLSEAQANLLKREEALESAIEGSANDPAMVEGYLALGRAFVEMDMYAPAVWPLQTYAVYRSDDATGWAYLGRAQAGMGDLESGLISAMNALFLNDRFSLAYTTLGVIYLDMAEFQAAVENFDRANRFGTPTYDSLYGLGKSYYSLGDYPRALENLNASIDRISQDEKTLARREKKTAEAYAVRALIYETNPDLIGDAITNWQWILELQGSAPETRALAEAHLLQLTGGAPVGSATPTLPAALTETATATIVPAETPTPIPTTAVPSPTRTPTPKKTVKPE